MLSNSSNGIAKSLLAKYDCSEQVHLIAISKPKKIHSVHPEVSGTVCWRPRADANQDCCEVIGGAKEEVDDLNKGEM